MIGLLLRIFKEEGLLGYYKGFGATMLNTFSTRKLACFSIFDISPSVPEYAYFFFYFLFLVLQIFFFFFLFPFFFLSFLLFFLSLLSISTFSPFYLPHTDFP